MMQLTEPLKPKPADEAQRVFTETGEFGTIPMAADAEVKKMRGDLALALAELASLRERYLEKHPKIIEKRSSIEAPQESLKKAENRIFDSIMNKAKLAKATDVQLAGVLTIRKSEQQSMNQKASSTTTCRALLRNRRQCTISPYRGKRNRATRKRHRTKHACH